MCCRIMKKKLILTVQTYLSKHRKKYYLKRETSCEISQTWQPHSAFFNCYLQQLQPTIASHYQNIQTLLSNTLSMNIKILNFIIIFTIKFNIQRTFLSLTILKPIITTILETKNNRKLAYFDYSPNHYSYNFLNLVVYLQIKNKIVVL